MKGKPTEFLEVITLLLAMVGFASGIGCTLPGLDGDDDTTQGDDDADDDATADDDDTTTPMDADGDGWNENVDCDDSDASVNPDANEIPCDNVDNDCDGTVDAWIPLPGGSFVMGNDDSVSAEQPEHLVTIPALEVWQHEVTVGEYDLCIQIGGCTLPQISDFCTEDDMTYAELLVAPDLPMNCVSFEQASLFCNWLSGRLLSESEWEYAATSAGSNELWPWGDTPDDASCDYVVMDDANAGGEGCGTLAPMEVCSRTAGNTRQGLCDMVGNLDEFVLDCWHDNYIGAPADGSAWLDCEDPDSKVNRGDCYLSTPDRITYRGNVAPDACYYRGFRCAR